MAVKHKIETLRDLIVIAIIAGASFMIAISSAHPYFAAVFAAEAAAAAVIAARIARPDDDLSAANATWR